MLEAIGLLQLKALLSQLVLPPAGPLLLLVLGCLVLRRRHRLLQGWIAVCCVATWLLGTAAVGEWLAQGLLQPNQALPQQQLQRVRAEVAAGRKVAVIVLGAGAQHASPEYGEPMLTARSLERLHFGLWLARQTGAPLGYTGGASHLQPGSPREATAAARVAERDHGLKLTWVEDTARDTRENARATLALLRPWAADEVLLVTHDWHMRRGLRAFNDEAARLGMRIPITASPMAVSTGTGQSKMAWVPSADGAVKVRNCLREWLGLLMGS